MSLLPPWGSGCVDVLKWGDTSLYRSNICGLSGGARGAGLAGRSGDVMSISSSYTEEVVAMIGTVC
jgi:hypothetical protein